MEALNLIPPDLNSRFSETTLRDSAKAAVESDFLSLLATLDRRFINAGLGVSKPTSRMLEALHQLSPARQAVALNDLLDALIVSGEFETERTRTLTRDQEILFLRRYLARNRSVLANEDFVDRVSTDDAIEVYSLEGLQIFRSWSCFKVISYSLADLLVLPWLELFERPRAAEERALTAAMESVGPGFPLVDFRLPEYLMAETLEGHSNAFYMHMKYVTAVLNEETGAPVGICCVSSARLADRTKGELNLSFI